MLKLRIIQWFKYKYKWDDDQMIDKELILNSIKDLKPKGNLREINSVEIQLWLEYPTHSRSQWLWKSN